MGIRKLGVVGLGLLVAACGGGAEEPATTASAGTGGEQVTVSRSGSPVAAGEVVEVDESRLPTTAPRIDMAAAPETPAGTETQAEPVAQATAPAQQDLAIQEVAREICPADIETLRVRARNLSRGAVIILTARGEADVDRLRDRMRELALAHSAEHAQQCDDPAHGEGVTTSTSTAHRIADPSSPMLAVHDLRLVEIENGVRLEMRHADDVERVSVRELRMRVREDAAALDEGVCPLSFQMS